MSDFVLNDFLPYQLNVLAGRVSREFAAVYRREAGLTIPEWRVLAHLSQQGSVSVREIVERVDMDKSMVSRAAARLEQAGLVSKSVADGDRRLVALRLTPQGRALVDRLVPLARRFEAEVLKRLGPEARPFRASVAKLLKEMGD